MIKKKKLFIICTGILFFLVILSIIPISSNNKYEYPIESESPKSAASLEGAENIIVMSIFREAELNGFGVVNIIDTMVFKNKNTNPINSILIGIPITYSENLIFYEATGSQDNTLSIEKTNLVMSNYEMIAIYFETPLISQESTQIRFVQSYKDMLTYSEDITNYQNINFIGPSFPLLPYKAEGSIQARYEIPSSSNLIESPSWTKVEGKEIIFEVTKLDPFLENLVEDTEEKEIMNIVFSDSTKTKLEAEKIIREITINSFGIIKVNEEFTIRNRGPISIEELDFEIPGPAKAIRVYDDLGEILGITVEPENDYYNLTYKDLNIDLSENRVKINSDTKFRFNIQYFLPFEKHFSLNWFQESIKIDLLTTIYDYLGKDQTIKIKIEGCYSLEAISVKPNSIEYSSNSLFLVFESDYVSPLETKEIQFTFTIHILDMMFRPLIFMIILILISSAYVLIIKLKKEEGKIISFAKDAIPIKELREFCSLLEEKNALLLEIRQSEEDLKRKKIIKKKYRNILEKNTAKIQEIDKEIFPFKKIVSETNPTFENLIKKIDFLEAERVSVRDSLSLLETRYKKGRLPSKTVYLKLSDNFLSRQKKIDRSIDKNIQTLRSYLL